MMLPSILLLTLGFFCSFLYPSVALAEGYKIKTIVIDAGHGGKDPGAIGYSKSKEKDITLAVSLKLGALIRENYPDIKVVYTRKTDVFIELQERAAIANKANADLFISIHCNANDNKTVYGAETYCLGLHRTEANLEVAKRENSVILMEDNYVEKYDGFDPNAAEAHIIFSLFQNAFLNQSVSFASKIDQLLETTADRKSRGVKQAGFLVLYKTTMPGVLVELGFISNKLEEAFLASQNGQEKTALGIFKAFKTYRAEIESASKEEIIQNLSPPKQILNPTTTPEKKIESIIVNTEQPKEKIAGESIPQDETPVIFFKVQFAASKVMLPKNEEPLKNVVEYEIESADNGFFRYLSGKFISLDIAKDHQNILKSLGFSDAFVVPYINGEKRISMKTYFQEYQK